jgi:hypothetical protein
MEVVRGRKGCGIRVQEEDAVFVPFGSFRVVSLFAGVVAGCGRPSALSSQPSTLHYTE